MSGCSAPPLLPNKVLDPRLQSPHLYSTGSKDTHNKTKEGADKGAGVHNVKSQQNRKRYASRVFVDLHVLFYDPLHKGKEGIKRTLH